MNKTPELRTKIIQICLDSDSMTEKQWAHKYGERIKTWDVVEKMVSQELTRQRKELTESVDDMFKEWEDGEWILEKWNKLKRELEKI